MSNQNSTPNDGLDDSEAQNTPPESSSDDMEIAWKDWVESQRRLSRRRSLNACRRLGKSI